MPRCVALALVPLLACSKGSTADAPASGSAVAPLKQLATKARTDEQCEALPFAASTPVPEASGAAWLTIGDKPQLVVVSDSGNKGAYGIVDPETGETGEQGALPLGDGASDDLEGAAVRGGKLYAITSSGWIRVWERREHGFALVDGPYPLGPVTLPKTKHNNDAPDGDGMVCDGPTVNCGRNYEGLCLAPDGAPAGDCVGFAASKADGHLYCLTEELGRLVAHHDRPIPEAIERPGALADCAFSPAGALWAGANSFDVGRLFRVEGWQHPASAKVEKQFAFMLGFPETLAVRGDVIYRMSDTGGAPSLMARWRCRMP